MAKPSIDGKREIMLQRMTSIRSLSIVACILGGIGIAHATSADRSDVQLGLLETTAYLADGSTVHTRRPIDMEAYIASGGTRIVSLPIDDGVMSNGCDDETGGGDGGDGCSGGTTSLPVVPVFPPPPPPPTMLDDSIAIATVHQQVVPHLWYQTIRWYRTIHANGDGTFGIPGPWGNPLVTPHQGEMPVNPQSDCDTDIE